MRIFFPSLLLACLSTGAFAAGGHDSVQMQNPIQHIVLDVSRRAASVGIIGHGQVEFRPEALVSHGRSLNLTPGTPRSSSGRIVQTLGHGLEAWYINTPFGIEQGFTLERPLGGGLIGLRMGLGGSLLPVRRGAGLRFSAIKDPNAILEYSNFIAYDADHRTLTARMVLAGQELTLSVDTRGARYPVTLDPLMGSSPVPLFTPDHTTSAVGASVAMSSDGTIVIVGAPYAHTGEGEAYVYSYSNGTWSEPEVLSNPAPNTFIVPPDFGRSVALSSDGTSALVAAPSAYSANGAVYAYTRSSNTWSGPVAMSTSGVPAVSNFGSSVSMSSDGQTVVIGAFAANGLNGAVFAYNKISGNWGTAVPFSTTGVASQGNLGWAVSLSSDGKTALVGAPGAYSGTGVVYVYTNDGSGWSLPSTALSTPSGVSAGAFGLSVALSGDAQVALVAAPFSNTSLGTVYAYTQSGGVWSGPAALYTSGVARKEFGRGVAVSADGKVALVGAPFTHTNTGAAFVYTRSGTTWNGPLPVSQNGVESDPDLGSATTLSSDGQTAAVAATGINPAYVYYSTLENLSLTILPSPGMAKPGGQLVLKLKIENKGGSINATHVTLHDVLPAGTSYVSSDAGSGACTYISSSNSLDCSLASLPPGASGTWQLSITFETPVTAGLLTNVLSFSLDQPINGPKVVTTQIINDAVPVAKSSTVSTPFSTMVTDELQVTPGYTGQKLTYAVVVQPVHGKVTITDRSTGAFSYRPTTGFMGTDSFTFYAGDGLVNSNIAKETVTVQATGGGESSSGGGSFGILGILTLLAAGYGRRATGIRR